MRFFCAGVFCPLAVAMVFCALAPTASAQSLVANHNFAAGRGALIESSFTPLVETPELNRGSAISGSLFAGRTDGSFFATPAPRALSRLGLQSFGLDGLRNLIASAEAGPSGYDAIQYGAKRLPPRPPTQLTVAEINQWIDDTPGQPHAIGRYQMIPPTFRRLMRALGADANDRFSPELQDRAAEMLIREAGYEAFLAGQLDQTSFMNNLAKIWAGLPTSSGKSHYDGYAGNKAVLSWAHYRTEMDRLFPRG